MDAFRRPAALSGACAAAALLLLAGPGASARAVDLAVCTGSNSTSYSPAMTLASQTGALTYSDAFDCTSNDPGAATASTGGTYTGPYGCLEPVRLPGFTGTLTLRWADSTTSAYAYTSVAGDVLVGGSYVFTGVGSITSGKFSGAATTMVITVPTLSVLQCLTTGITTTTGEAALTVTGA